MAEDDRSVIGLSVMCKGLLHSNDFMNKTSHLSSRNAEKGRLQISICTCHYALGLAGTCSSFTTGSIHNVYIKSGICSY